MKARHRTSSRRRGTTSVEVVLGTFVIVVVSAGLYYLAQRSVTKLFDFISMFAGSPY